MEQGVALLPPPSLTRHCQEEAEWRRAETRKGEAYARARRCVSDGEGEWEGGGVHVVDVGGS